MKFLELRLKDPSSLYDVDDIRAHLRPMKRKLIEEKMVANKRKKEGEFDFNKKRSPEGKSITSPTPKTET